MPCGELCDGEGVNPVTEEPVAVPTPSPETAAPTTATADPGQEETVPPTPAPVETPAPSTAEPTPPRTASPFTQEGPSSDVTMAPVRTETLPPAATMSPVAPVDPVVPNVSESGKGRERGREIERETEREGEKERERELERES